MSRGSPGKTAGCLRKGNPWTNREEKQTSKCKTPRLLCCSFPGGKVGLLTVETTVGEGQSSCSPQGTGRLPLLRTTVLEPTLENLRGSLSLTRSPTPSTCSTLKAFAAGGWSFSPVSCRRELVFRRAAYDGGVKSRYIAQASSTASKHFLKTTFINIVMSL